ELVVRPAEAVEHLHLVLAEEVDAGVAALGDHELDVQVAVAEGLVGVDVGAVVDGAAEEGAGGGAGAAADELLGVGGVEPDIGEDLPGGGAVGVAELPAGQVFTVKEGHSALVPGRRRGEQREGKAGNDYG